MPVTFTFWPANGPAFVMVEAVDLASATPHVTKHIAAAKSPLGGLGGTAKAVPFPMALELTQTKLADYTCAG